jgi:hypothetical protein
MGRPEAAACTVFPVIQVLSGTSGAADLTPEQARTSLAVAAVEEVVVEVEVAAVAVVALAVVVAVAVVVAA